MEQVARNRMTPLVNGVALESAIPSNAAVSPSPEEPFLTSGYDFGQG